MTRQEFEERIFDVINESEEICIRDVKIFDETGGLSVIVEDGTRFVLRCYSAE